MTTANEQIAAHAVNGITAAEKAAFVEMVEAGNVEVAGAMMTAYALRSINRQITMANMAIQNPAIMSALCEAAAA